MYSNYVDQSQHITTVPNRQQTANTVPSQLPVQCRNHCSTKQLNTSSTETVTDKKDGYRQQNVRQRQKLISIIDYDVCI